MKTNNITPIFLAAFLIGILNTGCWSKADNGRLRHGYNDTIQTRDVGSFEKIELDGNFTVYLQNGPTCNLTLEGDEEILNVVLTEVDNGSLKISYMNEAYSGMEQPVVVNIKVVNLLELTGRKSISAYSTDILQVDNLKLDFAGAVNMDLEISGNSLTGQFAGASNVVLNGKIDTLQFEMPGAGKLKAFDLLARNVDLNLAGAGKAEVNVSEQLKVEMAGACYVTYKGNPTQVFSNISGIGRLKKVE
jgi:hypothetical protein